MLLVTIVIIGFIISITVYRKSNYESPITIMQAMLVFVAFLALIASIGLLISIGVSVPREPIIGL